MFIVRSILQIRIHDGYVEIGLQTDRLKLLRLLINVIKQSGWAKVQCDKVIVVLVCCMFFFPLLCNQQSCNQSLSVPYFCIELLGINHYSNCKMFHHQYIFCENTFVNCAGSVDSLRDLIGKALPQFGKEAGWVEFVLYLCYPCISNNKSFSNLNLLTSLNNNFSLYSFTFLAVNLVFNIKLQTKNSHFNNFNGFILEID